VSAHGGARLRVITSSGRVSRWTAISKPAPAEERGSGQWSHRCAGVGELEIWFPLPFVFPHRTFALHGASVWRDGDAEALGELGIVAGPLEAGFVEGDRVGAGDASDVEVEHRAGVIRVVRPEERDPFGDLGVVHLRVHADEGAVLDPLEGDVAAEGAAGEHWV